MKAYERLAIRAAIEKSFDLARLALMVNPIIGDWELSTKVPAAIVNSDRGHLGYLGAFVLSLCIIPRTHTTISIIW